VKHLCGVTVVTIRIHVGQREWKCPGADWARTRFFDAGRSGTCSGAGGIHPAPDRRGFVGYMLVYPVLTAVASLRGYAEYVWSSGRRWE